MQISAIIFDLDGTLLDSIGDIAACGNDTLGVMGFPPLTVSLYKAYVGDGLRNLARKVLPEGHRNEESVAKFLELYRVQYGQRWNETTAPYPGVLPLLAQLSQLGIRMAVLSNKRDEFTKVCVSELLSGCSFSEVRGESEVTPTKPDPRGALAIATNLGVEPARCLFVGDSEIDAETALRAGMPFVAVEWGYRSRAQLEQAGAQLFVREPGELLGVLGKPRK